MDNYILGITSTGSFISHKEIRDVVAEIKKDYPLFIKGDIGRWHGDLFEFPKIEINKALSGILSGVYGFNDKSFLRIWYTKEKSAEYIRYFVVNQNSGGCNATDVTEILKNDYFTELVKEGVKRNTAASDGNDYYIVKWKSDDEIEILDKRNYEAVRYRDLKDGFGFSFYSLGFATAADIRRYGIS